ncbi:MAG: helix-turn-helix domain-containing protein [Candidatus Nomurabacteria bacterium]
MESFKKVISLNQAAQLSGYSQDYLGFLVRKGEIKGMKKGRAWFTTEEEVNNYIFKKKVRHQEFAIKDFFSPTRTKNIIIATIIIFIGGFLLLSSFTKSKPTPTVETQSAVKSDGGSIRISD